MSGHRVSTSDATLAKCAACMRPRFSRGLQISGQPSNEPPEAQVVLLCSSHICNFLMLAAVALKTGTMGSDLRLRFIPK